MREEVKWILSENTSRNEKFFLKFDPITGEGGVGNRFKLELSDFSIGVQWIPEGMLLVPFVKQLKDAGSFSSLIKSFGDSEMDEEKIERAKEAFVRIRCEYDFEFWAFLYVRILSKIPGEGEIRFNLNRPQKHFLDRLEKKRVSNDAIRFILLKARQWGGSTLSQIYMVWLQLVHKKGLNSVIISQTKHTSFTIKSMIDRALESYPLEMLYDFGDGFSEGAKKMENVGLSGDYKRIPSRDCTVTIASYENPDAMRGDAYSLVHCSEVGLWSPTGKKSPETVIRSACSGVALMPYTMIVLESTANGTGNFFHREYLSAKEGLSQFEPVFVSWMDVELYRIPFESGKEREEFALWLWENRENQYAESDREEPGCYLWWLWESRGATLEAIHWYINERKGKNDHGVMASEYPSDDVEAFVYSGQCVFDHNHIESFRAGCRPPRYIGELSSSETRGKGALDSLRFADDKRGRLFVWEKPEEDAGEERVANRYLVVMDVGGRSEKADWTVISVFDRIWMIDGGTPVVVAQWRGHGDHDITAWKAAQIASWYDNALLVIESNTLETKDKNRDVDGDQSHFILNQIRSHYPNLYARKQSADDIRQRAPRKYGFHTNVVTKQNVISTLQMAVREHLYVERDAFCLDEMGVYERRKDGSYGAQDGFHDDILMTRAIGLHICFNEMPLPKIVKKGAVSKVSVSPKRVVGEAQIL